MAKPATRTTASPAVSEETAGSFDVAVAAGLAGKAAPNADRSPMHTAASTDENEPAHDPAHVSPRVRTRTRQESVQSSPFDIPKDEIPEGSSYEWKRYSVTGNTADHDPFYLASMRRQGWEPVDPKRHPTWVPPGYDKPCIIRDGQILMERPQELTDQARAEMRSMAKTQVKEAEQRLGLSPKVNGSDTMTRDHEGVRPRVVKEHMRPMPIEE